MPYLTDRTEILNAIEKNPEKARRLWIEDGYKIQHERFIKKAKEKGISIRILPEEAFKKRFKNAKAHICLERDEFTFIDPDAFLNEIKKLNKKIFLCAFDGIYDPQNLGNIIRSAVCFNMDGIIIPKDRCCGITEAVIRVSKGAIEHIKITRVTNLARYIEALKDMGVFCFCLDERGEKKLSDIDLNTNVCLVFGSEEGVRRLVMERCDETVRIPTNKNFLSLNVATSFAVSAYEVMRQRGFGVDD
ncbi:MAG: 23S rRNA (guanosine(2251)-2'-O)-methyltransferase RlmB, partial [Syntrophorhabdaceae bacterium]|nr:23S rRNA (guanosine(2251)-2'-O)-methyltransferase RlmB [Syntrophorhabdaceae bacterium]